ncbi:MAG: ferredoxin family protein, partial [Candidatus Hydrothermarchaeota archaeon]|nr:ferredoxin family protein [Candidatus Hydrothermarchaeota archaeon]
MKFPPEFKVVRDFEKCTKCKRCVIECTFDVHSYDKKNDRMAANDENCVACQRCVFTCQTKALIIERRPPCFSDHPTWTEWIRRDIMTQAQTGSVILASMGNEKPY